MIGAPKEDEVLPIPKHVHNVDAILNERHQQYGRFIDVAAAAQSIKEALKSLPNWNLLGDDQKECLEMIASKVARILNGDTDHVDSWVDIAGYAKLVSDRLEGTVR